MTRRISSLPLARILAITGALAVAGLVLWLVLRGEPTPAHAVGSPQPAQPAAVTRDQPRAAPNVIRDGVIADDDRRGTLRLEGQVIDGDGHAVAGASVAIDSRPTRTTTTEDDGSFVFDGLLGRTYQLVATHGESAAGPVAARLTERSEPIVLRLERGAGLEVIVTAAQAPVAAARVELRGTVDRTTMTDAAGVARFAGLPSGGYGVAAIGDGHARASSWAIVTGGTRTVRLALERGAEVAGRVLDPDGHAIAGATVRYGGVSDWGQSSGEAITTGEDGRFRIAALQAGSFRFTARHAQHAPGVSEVVTHDGATPRTGIEIRLAPGAALAGIVVDRAGAAVPWARVRAGERTVGLALGKTRETTADAAGQFRIDALPRTRIDVVATNERAASETTTFELAAGAREDARLVLGLDGTIAGVVVDSAGEPVDGAQVHAEQDAAERDDRRLRDDDHVLTDAAGRFAFHGLPVAGYSLRASPPNESFAMALARDEVTARTGDTGVRIVLAAGGTLAGKVVFADGRHAAAFTVSLGGWGTSIPVTSKDGTFELKNIPPRSYRVAIRGPGFTERALPELAVAAGKTTDAGTITVERGRGISGRVVDSAGRPVANATVVAGPILWGTGSKATTPAGFGGPPGAGLIKETTTGERGEFSLVGVGRGTRHVVADHATLGRSTPITLPSQTDSATDLELVVVGAGVLEGKVTLAGKPAANIVVTAQSKTVAEAMFSVISGADGSYRFDRLAADRYQVSAMVGTDPIRGIAFHSRTTTVASGPPTRLDLAVAAGDVTLVVTPTAAKPVKLALIESFSGALDARIHADLDRLAVARDRGQSTFGMAFGGRPTRITGLSPGTYTVCACPYPDEIGALESEEYMLREGDKLPVFCKQVQITAEPREQALELRVEIPKLVPPP